MIQFELPQKNANIIKVIGVGGGGSNAVNYMYDLGLDGVDFIVCNTDQKALLNSAVPTKIQLGPSLTQGLGAGANPEIGMRACKESIEEIERLLSNNTKMVFVTAGMGGGTGTGGAPIVAKVARDLGILTVGIVTTPFSYEGKRRKRQAEEGIVALRDYVDTILVISNDKLRHQFGNIPASQAFSRADDILATATKCITDVINSQGHIVVDFADVSTVMRDGKVAILGSATAIGENRAYEAVEQAINSPLLNDSSIKGAKWVLLNINSSHGFHEHTLDEVEMIQAYVQDQAGDECDVIFGTGFDDNLGEKISVTVIATGFEYNKTDTAYTSEHKKPYSESMKEVYALDGTPVNAKADEVTRKIAEKQMAQEVKAAPILAAVPKVDNYLRMPIQEALPKNDPYAPTMIEVEQPAVPSMLAMGFGMSMNNARIPITNTQVPTSHTMVKPSFVETPAPIAEVVKPTPTPNVEATRPVPIAEAPKPVEIPVQKPKVDLDFSQRLTEILEPFPASPIVENKAPIVEQEIENKIVFQLDTNTPPPAPPATPVVDVQAELNKHFNVVEKTEMQMKDEYVTLKGVTINRKKGSRYLTDGELEAEVNFELQKRAFEDRASKLRSMSFNVNKADISSEEINQPAYMRRNIPLDTHPSSSEDVYSTINITDAKHGESSISNLNSFLHGKKPD